MRTIDDPATPASPVDAILTEMEGAFRELRCAATERMVKQGVSMTQVHILWLLGHHGELPMSRLAELLDVSVSNATGLIDRMEERGLVERVRVADDRRVVLVRPASGGRQMLEEVEGLRRGQMRSVLTHLDAAAQERVRGAFSDLREAIATELGSDADHQHFTAERAGR
ncbi:MAG: MarR family transcriptional regulator [Chloroflexota bacterium]|mgnify:FL=1